MISRVEFGVVGRSRGDGRAGSAVAAAAYNRCAALSDGTRTYDFSRKTKEHIGHAVMLPPGAPPTLLDPEALWRAAEACERRSDAQLARQLLLSIPREVPPADRLDFAQFMVTPYVADGAAAQVDVHCIRAADGGEQPHMHVLLSLRRVTDRGLAPTKCREWNVAFREDGGRAERRRVEERANRWLAAHGLAVCLDLRSRVARGDDTPPEPSAPRADWQAWLRCGADPSRAPITVAAVLTHRARRAELDRAQQETRAAADLVRQLTPRMAAAPAAPPPAPQAPPPQESATMPARPRTTSGKSGPRKQQHEPWMEREGGLDGMSDALRRSAERSYEEWSKRLPEAASRHDLADYVEYVQRQHEAERRRRADEEPSEDEEAAAPPPARPSVRPDEPTARTAHRVSDHAHAVLSGGAPPLPSPDWRARHDQSAGTTAYRTPEGGRILDRGDRLEPDEDVSAERLVELAAAKGWTGLTLTGDKQFRESVARAAALREPPVPTDYVLPPAVQRQVSAALAQRAAEAVAPLDVAAVRTMAAANPGAAAIHVLDRQEAATRAGLAGRPTGSTDPREIARPGIADAIARRQHAQEEAREALEAAAAHRGEHGVVARLLDPSARRRQARLDDEAARLDKAARRLDRTHDRTIRTLEKSAERQAKANRSALDDWRWSPIGRKVERDLSTLAALREAANAGAPDVVASLSTGDVRAAAAALPVWKADQAARQAEQEEQHRRKGEAPRDTAVRLAAAAEHTAGSDPRALEAARRVTAAAVAGHDGTVAALVGGDPAAAAQAAAEWRQREEQRRREAEEADRRRDLERQPEAAFAGP